MTWVLLISFLLLLLLDVPIVFCMLISSTLALLATGVNPVIVGLEMSRSMASFYPFLAVPFFILAGDLMNQGGLSKKIIDFAGALVGHRRGGLAHVTTLSAMMFGAISGASSATCAAIGSVMIPAMEKQGYPRPFSSALAACSGTTGALIPPSIVLLIYGVIAGVSIEKLFLAGVGPGVLIGLGLMIVSSIYARKMDLPLLPRASAGQTLKALGRAGLALLLMVIIFGGIMGGVFTATEASAVAVVYALVVGLFIYRGIRPRELPAMFATAAKTTATLSFLIAAAGLFSWTLTIGYVPQTLASGLLGGVDHLLSGLAGSLGPENYFLLKKVVILLTLNAALLVVGMLIDAGPALLLVTPVTMPICKALDMSPVMFGAIIVTNLVIGLITPPMATTLYVASGIGKVQISEMVPYVLRFMIAMVIVQLIVTFVEPVSMFLPSFIK